MEPFYTRSQSRVIAGIRLNAEAIPVRRKRKRCIANRFGLEPLYLACEGSSCHFCRKGKCEAIVAKVTMKESIQQRQQLSVK
ncbi:MAG: hypothetical protein ACLRYY_07965 [Anaerobutyricum soehngenii]